MTRTVDLGAPSLTGKDANELVASAFADAIYPLKVVVKNHMPHDAVFPEVEGLFLRHCANAQGSQKLVEIASVDLFQRLASSVEQVAELNGYELALTISEVAETAEIGVEANVEIDAIKKPSEGLSYEQLKDALKAKGIEFLANTKKADLAALLDAAPLEEVSTAGTEGAGDAVVNA